MIACGRHCINRHNDRGGTINAGRCCRSRTTDERDNQNKNDRFHFRRNVKMTSIVIATIIPKPRTYTNGMTKIPMNVNAAFNGRKHSVNAIKSLNDRCMMTMTGTPTMTATRCPTVNDDQSDFPLNGHCSFCINKKKPDAVVIDAG